MLTLRHLLFVVFNFASGRKVSLSVAALVLALPPVPHLARFAVSSATLNEAKTKGTFGKALRRTFAELSFMFAKSFLKVVDSR
jgi:hypothetical protein